MQRGGRPSSLPAVLVVGRPHHQTCCLLTPWNGEQSLGYGRPSVPYPGSLVGGRPTYQAKAITSLAQTADTTASRSSMASSML